MTQIKFRPISLEDCDWVQEQVYTSECRNCDLNFMNLMSWRSLFRTEIAFHEGWLLFRFWVEGRLAYLPPIGTGDFTQILADLKTDALSLHEPFCLMGVCDSYLKQLTENYPGLFHSCVDPAYTDYVYLRESLANLSGKKLQPKRNHIHRFAKYYPNYSFQSLDSDSFQDCIDLVGKWQRNKGYVAPGRLSSEDELTAMRFTFEHWDHLKGMGGILKVDKKVIAFTYGAPINYDTFDICVEKADVDFDGAFAMINREFVCSLPEQFKYVNREEDLGLEGLRRAKLSYQPVFLLQKHILTFK